MNSITIVKYIILLFLIYIPGWVFSQNYLWPTNSSEYLSSSFCEYREGHYHSAIDIKTWNTEGYPCYAVADGYIKRIRISPFGYGKVLYLQLDDGQTAVYAHLQKFTKDIDKKIRAQQFKNEKYRLDWWPKNLKVKKGDIIAYTGRTGIGVPHLHFEIRNKKDNPINPLQYYPQVKDQIRPNLQEIAVIPLSEFATINGSYLPQSFPLKHIKDGIYIIKEPLYVEDLVGIAVKGFDQANDVHNKYGFYQTQLELSGQKIFQINYDELEFSTTEHINTEIFYPFLSANRKRFQKLYIEPFNPLPFYNRSLGSDGTIDIQSKPVQFTVYVSDFSENRSIISGEFLPSEKFDLQISEKTRIGTKAYIKIIAPPIKNLNLYIENESSWTPIQSFEILEGRISNPEQGLLIRADLGDSTVKRIKLVVNKISREVSFDPPAIIVKEDPKLHFLGKKIIAEYRQPEKFFIHKQLGLNTSLTTGNPDESNLQIVLSAKNISMVSKTHKIFSDSLVNLLKKNMGLLLPKEKSQVAWFDSAIVITSSDESVNDTTLITAKIYKPDSLLDVFPIASKIFEVSPNNFPIFRSITIKLRADSLPEWGNWSIFKTNGHNKLTYLNSKIDTSKMELTSRTSSMGKFVIAADTIAPEIEIKSPQNGRTYRSSPKIRLHLKDTISGIGNEEDISLSMDGNYVLQEWDPEEDDLIGILENDISKGNHVFSVSIRDRAGNISRQAVYFSVE